METNKIQMCERKQVNGRNLAIALSSASFWMLMDPKRGEVIWLHVLEFSMPELLFSFLKMDTEALSEFFIKVDVPYGLISNA